MNEVRTSLYFKTKGEHLKFKKFAELRGFSSLTGFMKYLTKQDMTKHHFDIHLDKL